MARNIVVLDESFQRVCILDVYESCIWTIRYNAYGDFELYAPMTSSIKNNVKKNYYLIQEEDERVMIVEEIEITTDAAEGSKVIISGRSLESILYRRIVWGQLILDGYLESQIEKLLDQNIISPTDSNRKISNFIYKKSDDQRIQELKIQMQFTGDTLYDVITTVCSRLSIGFKIILNDEFQFIFEFYMGEDRSYEQSQNPYVVFSPSYGNLTDSSYIESEKNLGTITLVGGEGEGAERKYYAVGDETITGLQRREFFTDARDISSSTENGDLTPSQYNALLKSRGEEKLKEAKETILFEGSAEDKAQFSYGIDFFIGDVVEVENEYGYQTRARITEYIKSDNTSSGSTAYPTFENVVE